MKLEDKLYTSFFYPFLIGVFLSTLIVTIFLGIFTGSYNDKHSKEKIIELEIKYSQMNIKSVNVILTNILLKNQASINELILSYQNNANKIINKDINELKLNEDKFKCVYDLTEEYLKKNEKELELWAYWYLDKETKSFDDIKDIRVKKEILSFSTIIHNLYSALGSTSNTNSIFEYFLFFEETDLFISFPVSYDYQYDYFTIFYSYETNPYWCANEQGEKYNIYYIKCRDFYVNINKAKTESYDNNYLSQKNRTIFITNFYKQLDTPDSDNVYTLCIQFYDPISKGNGYICSDVSQEDLVSAFDSLNSNLQGYYFITSVGFNNVFFFPSSRDSPKTITENIFKWDIDYYTIEKTFFYENIQKILSSNYIDYIGEYDLYEEVYVNGKNSSDQFFYINNEKYKYWIYPIIMTNLNGQREHVLSIIYIYNNKLYLNELNMNNNSIFLKLFLIIIIFIVFGWGLLHIIILTFNMLAKHIAISIKNVNYMLKGINIGGNKRLYYLDYLKRRQDDNLEKLEKMYLLKEKKINNLNEDLSNDISEIKEKNNIINIEMDNVNSINSNKEEEINKNIDYNEKYDEESDYIENEINFYDYDDSLLQCRPFEIEQLVKFLIDIKSVMILTSSDLPVGQIIDYSYSEDIFKCFKNKEGSSICQSNIGNLQIQLLKYDKAIYHLALSLQDNKLKRFLNNNLSDEFDQDDSLMKRLSSYFNKSKIKEKNIILVTKQQNNINDNFSQKIIGNLINIRYCRLIYAYYKFFKGMKKLEKINEDTIKGQFMNTYFHTINFYHKTIIQYIYLSYAKNDLIKIGESILDYIEFLIKFKLKTSSDKKYYLKLQNKDRPEFREKQKLKRKLLDKIVNWFNLFDDYVTYVIDNTSLSDDKNIVDDLTHNLKNSENKEFNTVSQSVFLFKVNIQRSDFLKGKFALCCKNYKDALFYFIRSSKKKSIVIDGLIKKRSLKHIFKIFIKMKKKYEKYRLIKLSMIEKFNELNKDGKKRSGRKKITFKSNKEEYKNETFYDEIQKIRDDIIKNINECNAQKDKDIIILIDFNIYNKTQNKESNLDKINAFISQTKIILNDYLSLNDRLGVFIFIKKYKIICPLMNKYQLDINNFNKDLIYYKNIIVKENVEQNEYDINFDEIGNNNIELVDNIYSDISNEEEESIENDNKKEMKYNLIEGLIGTINYIKNYFKMKESVKNEKFIILFTDLFNSNLRVDEKIQKIFGKLKKNKESIFLLVGKNKKFKTNNDKFSNINDDNNFVMELFLNKFGEKSETINFENMNKIKTILSFHNVIKDEITYPNELYK